MTYYSMRQWPDAGRCPERLRAIASSLLQAHVLVRKTVAGLSYERLWHRAQPEASSFGNLLLHICGSEHHWIEYLLGGRPLLRDRDAEFAARDGQTLEQLLIALDETEARTHDVLAGLDADMDVTKEHAEGMSAEFILHYAAQHIAYHAGQMLAMRRSFEPEFELS